MIKIFEDIKNIDKTLLFNHSLSASGVEDIVSDIISNVRARGDKALFEYTERFDRAKLSSLERAASGKLEAGMDCSADTELIEQLKENISKL